MVNDRKYSVQALSVKITSRHCDETVKPVHLMHYSRVSKFCVKSGNSAKNLVI